MTATAIAPGPAATAIANVPRQLLIGGQWLDAGDGRTFATIDPATEHVIVDVAHGSAADVGAAVAAARAAFEDPKGWSAFTPRQRAHLLWRVGDLIEANADEFATLEALDNGKPFLGARDGDVAVAAELFRYFGALAMNINGTTIPVSLPTPHLAYTVHEPVGVVAGIVPWNFPLLMAAFKVAPALAAGNTVVLKPAEQTPLTALRLGRLLLEAGLPEGAINVVTGFGDAGAALVAHPDVDKVAFTGSTEVGKKIVQGAAGNLKKVSLELGGKAPNIVFADADLERAIAGSAHAAFFNQGQCCVNGSRMYVERSVAAEVAAGVNEIGARMRIGAGLSPDTEMGPLISKEQFDKVLGYVESGLRDGATVLGETGRVGERGYFVRPTVITNVREDMAVQREEIFGPVVTVVPFDTTDEAVGLANRTRYGLAAGVWTKNAGRAHQIAGRLRAGTVWVNSWHADDIVLPRGGFKESGWGRELGASGLADFMETKTIMADLAE